AIDEITKHLENKKLGKKTIQYKIRDWLISRQRYWGTPIPVVYCDKCGIIPVPEKELPVLLPENVEFTGQGNPLQNNEKFVNIKCPKCKGKAKRETDTMDTFVDSSWYFIRYCSNKYDKGAFDKLKVKYWMPVDLYVGGAEHAVLHLMYSRFFVKALRDMKLLSFNEPFKKLFNQGMLHKDGAVMSKSRGNIVTQKEISEKHGIDTARFFLLFIAGPDKDMEWDDKGIEGTYRILNKIYNLTDKVKSLNNKKDKNVISKLNKTIKDVTEHIDKLGFNLALISINEFLNYFNKNKEFISKKIYDDCLKKLILLINPFTPHLSEEMWEKTKNKGFSSITKWPSYDTKKIDYKIETAENMVAKTISDIKDIIDLIKIKQPKEISIFVAEKWLYDTYKKLQKEKSRNIGEIIKKIIVKGHEQEISKIVQAFIKDPGKISNTILDQVYEFKYLQESKSMIEKEFNCVINIIKAESSNEQKSKQAMPNKPAILIK
ncbi:MAG: class I tRNA ligase family protein, partial [Candidatus Woesearchaeota archaeon]|nr:class I tRNA ligase family protein [Candidatus Woesearchaeota archaeon]